MCQMCRWLPESKVSIRAKKAHTVFWAYDGSFAPGPVKRKALVNTVKRPLAIHFAATRLGWHSRRRRPLGGP